MSREVVLNNLLPLVQVAVALAQKYDVVVTNPPYMGSSSMGGKLTDYVKELSKQQKRSLCYLYSGLWKLWKKIFLSGNDNSAFLDVFGKLRKASRRCLPKNAC